MINDIRKALFDKLEASRLNTGSRLSQVKKITIGDPYQFAASELPALAIVGNGGSVAAQGTEYDRGVRNITIVLIFSLKDTLGAENPDRIESDFIISDITEGSYGDTQDSIIGILRQNISLVLSTDPTLVKATLGSDIDIVYAPNQRGEGAVHEARINFSYSFTTCR